MNWNETKEENEANNTVLIYEMRMTRRRKLKEQNKSFYKRP